MYTQFFGLKEKPFSIVPDPAFLYFSRKHSHAMTLLEYGLSEGTGFVLLTGDIGSGKTTLIKYMLNIIDNAFDVAVIFNTNVTAEDFIRLLLQEFDIAHKEMMGKAKALELLHAYLIKQFDQGRTVLLIVDEAQNLDARLLEEIRMLSNLQTDREMLLKIVIAGQPELRDKLRHPKLAQFAQRIAVSFHLPALDLEETRSYITHRIKKAHGPERLFTQAAMEKIFHASRGIPRTINLICDAALVYGFADAEKTISSDIISQVLAEETGMGLFCWATMLLQKS